MPRLHLLFPPKQQEAAVTITVPGSLYFPKQAAIRRLPLNGAATSTQEGADRHNVRKHWPVLDASLMYLSESTAMS